MSEDPRLLLIDMTSLRGNAATSMLKAAYFEGWTEGRLLHLQAMSWDKVGLAADFGQAYLERPDVNMRDEILSRFQPEIIFYRPVAGKPALHKQAMEIIQASDAPLAMWMMDDWPARLETEDPEAAERMRADLEVLFERSAVNYAISEGMARAFGARYGVSFEVAHNGVDPRDWRSIQPSKAKKSGRPVTLRYSGSLAPDMTRDSVYAVAEATSVLSAKGVPVRMQISTQDAWYAENASRFRGLKGVQIRRARHTDTGYRQWLSDADIVLLAYNFDEATRRYVLYSFANKTPELLASGAAVLAFGPADLETIAFLKSRGLAECIVEKDPDRLSGSIRALAEKPALRHELARKGRDYAFSQMDMGGFRENMRQHLRQLAERSHALAATQDADEVATALTLKFTLYRRLANRVADQAPFAFKLLQKPVRFLKRLVRPT